MIVPNVSATPRGHGLSNVVVMTSSIGTSPGMVGLPSSLLIACLNSGRK
jgi:hypothetical protein